MDPLGKIYEVLEDRKFDVVLKVIPQGKKYVSKELFKKGGWVYEMTFEEDYYNG